jgi:catechol 2,3-dioxygenase-like lactoylglutathione lyase family enzyme
MRLKIIAFFYGLLLVPLSVFGQGAQNKMETNKIDDTNKSERKNIMPETGNYGLSQIGQVAISVSDLERATAFYRDKLGMKYLFTANGMAFFDCDGIRLMLARLDKAESAGAKFVVYFKVEDIQKGYKTLLERGVKFEEEPELAAKTEKFDLWLACFRDSENNNLCLMSEVSRKK